MKSKNFLLSCIILIIFIGSITSSLLIGGYVGRFVASDSAQSGKQTEIIEKSVYYEAKSSQRYIDKNSPKDVVEKLLSDAEQHFTFEFNVNNPKQYQDDKTFILTNLENQYARLSVVFNKELTKKVTIRLLDDIETYEKDFNFVYEDGLSFGGFAHGSELIEIYENPVTSIDKFQLGQTISHELVHTFQHDRNKFVFGDMPTWYYEGMAESYAYPNEDMIIHKEIYKKIPNLDILDEKILSPNSMDYVTGYDGAQLFFTFLIDSYGEKAVFSLLDDVYPQKFDGHFEQVTGTSPNQAFENWIKSL